MKESKFSPVKGFLIAVIFFTAIPIFAQDSYEEYVKNYISGLRKFKNERDSAFSEMLRQQWEYFTIHQGIAPLQKPTPPEPYVIEKDTKPIDNKIPIAKPDNDSIVKANNVPNIPKPTKLPDGAKASPSSKTDSQKTNHNTPKQQSKPNTVETPIQNVKDITSIGNGNCSADFYGITVKIPIANDMQFKLNRIKEKDIAAAWEKLSSANYPPTIKLLSDIKATLRLNDFSYMLLINKLSNNYYGYGSNESSLFTMFAMVQSGYNVKVANINESLTLMYSTLNTVYDINFLNIDGDNFYLFKIPPSQNVTLSTYRGNFADNLKPISFDFIETPQLPSFYSREKLCSYNNFVITAHMNENLMNLYCDFPQVDYSVYKNNPVSKEMRHVAITPLREKIKGMTELDAVNFILNFIQHAFDYKTDHQQFNRERPLFPDESLYYPFNDCEDRTMLFALWIKELLGLDVVILEYPNHVAAAVSFSYNVSGNYILYNGRKYIVCDPTCINAKVGVTMPQFRTTPPIVNPYYPIK